MPRKLSLALLALAALIPVVLAALSCSDGNIKRRREEIPPAPTCGDGKVDTGEECDGSDLAGATCQTRGFDLGTLTCDAQCKYVTSTCVKLCGNGKIDPGEECDGTTGPLACASFGFRKCGADCKVQSTHCVTTPFSSGPSLSLSAGGVSTLTDLVPKGAGELVLAIPQTNNPGLAVYRYTLATGFGIATTLRFLGEVPALPIAGDFDGDGFNDVASVDGDGTADRYRFAGTGVPYVLEPLQPALDAGATCAAAGWVGAGKLDSDAAVDLIAYGCPTSLVPFKADAFLVFKGGTAVSPARTIAQAGIVAAALADANDDGLLDLLFVTEGSAELKILRAPDFAAAPSLPLPFVPSAIAAADLDGDKDPDLLAAGLGQVQILENTGVGFASRATVNATAFQLIAADLDLDGRPDLAWSQAGKISLRRNGGDFVFGAYELTTDGAAPLSLSFGDVDEDGDPELVATTGVVGADTTSYLFLNKVQ